MKNKTKIIICSILAFVLTLGLVVAIPFSVLGVKTSKLKADCSYLKEDTSYNEKVEMAGLELVKQHVSCGYASIEMISTYYGSPVTEDDLDARNGSISTASSKGFYKEILKSTNKLSFEGDDGLAFVVKNTYTLPTVEDMCMNIIKNIKY